VRTSLRITDRFRQEHEGFVSQLAERTLGDARLSELEEATPGILT